MKFESVTDCVFGTEVTFPEEEDFHRRRRAAEQANVASLLAPRSNNKEKDVSVPGKLVPATQFKKKMKQEVQEIIEDKYAAREFLYNVSKTKNERRKRNLYDMIAKSLNPEKKEIDFIRANINELYEVMPDQQEEKKVRVLELSKVR